MRIIESLHLTEPQEIVVVRPWRERLWSWPWRPHVSTKTVTVQVPSTKILQIGPETLVMHPATAKDYRRSQEELRWGIES